MRRAAGATTGEVNGVRWQARRELFRGRGLHRHRPRTARPCRTTMRRRRRRRRRSAGVTRRAAPICRARFSTSTPSADRPARTDRIRPIATPASTRFRAARPSASAAACDWMQPWFGASSRVRQRVEFDVADYDLQLQERSSACRTATRIARTRASRPTCRRTRRSDSPAASNGSARAAPARSSPPAPRATIPVERGVLGIFGEARWNATDRATVTAGVRGERITRDALPGDPLAFQPRPDFPEETINSVNPKIAGVVPSSRDRHAAARIVRHRHPSARCVRDRLHRQLGPEAGAQQERRIRRHADAGRRRRATRRAPRSSTATPI